MLSSCYHLFNSTGQSGKTLFKILIPSRTWLAHLDYILVTPSWSLSDSSIWLLLVINGPFCLPWFFFVSLNYLTMLIPKILFRSDKRFPFLIWIYNFNLLLSWILCKPIRSTLNSHFSHYKLTDLGSSPRRYN
jgi:hypothetical protein